jgi:hypothetical protein
MNRNARKNSPPASAGSPSQAEPALNPGDEAPAGTPGTGEDICGRCHGSGHLDGRRCPDCGGGGKVVRAIGGA